MSYPAVGKFLRKTATILPQILSLREMIKKSRGSGIVEELVDLNKEVLKLKHNVDLMKRVGSKNFPVTGFATIERVLRGEKRDFYDLFAKNKITQKDSQRVYELKKKTRLLEGGKVENGAGSQKYLSAPVVLLTGERTISEEQLMVDGSLSKHEAVVTIGKNTLPLGSPLYSVLASSFASAIRTVCVETFSPKDISILGGSDILTETHGIVDELDIYTTRCSYHFTMKASENQWYTIGIMPNASPDMRDKSGKPPVHLDDLLSEETRRGIMYEIKTMKPNHIHCLVANIGDSQDEVPPSYCNAIITSNSWTAGNDDLPRSVFTSMAIHAIGGMRKNCVSSICAREQASDLMSRGKRPSHPGK